ncbi:MAG TPA: CocE/NonD family hydrolase [Solirubrobacteraceae bacterium]
MLPTDVAGVEPGQQRLNGPQTTGCTYRNLSSAEFTIVTEPSVAVPMRDDVALMADVHRPDAEGRFPALVAASCYPRQIQNTGAPLGFVEAGATDFWVPRGYAHVIANVRGTGGSGGTYGALDATERRDMHDLVEWVAEQPWCDGRVGMIGISYFAMTQIAAACERPAHLRAIFPVATSADLYEAMYHHGLYRRPSSPGGCRASPTSRTRATRVPQPAGRRRLAGVALGARARSDGGAQRRGDPRDPGRGDAGRVSRASVERPVALDRGRSPASRRVVGGAQHAPPARRG